MYQLNDIYIVLPIRTGKVVQKKINGINIDFYPLYETKIEGKEYTVYYGYLIPYEPFTFRGRLSLIDAEKIQIFPFRSINSDDPNPSAVEFRPPTEDEEVINIVNPIIIVAYIQKIE